MLEDALGACVVDKLSACDEPLFHGYLAPGAEAIRQILRHDRLSVGIGCHGEHSPRAPRNLSTDESCSDRQNFFVEFMQMKKIVV
jgi:hypothetical protein